MLQFYYFDWQGTSDELKEMDEHWKKGCEMVEGITFKGRYVPHQPKYHFVYIFKTDNYSKFTEAWQKSGAPQRDYSKVSHGSVHVFTEPT
jgi:hypothetical protein